ncbi:MAG TPA: 2-dehydro-3-deoxygalactonokinase [Devosia sp.]|nr:2-dehydro-3-deoxygalactonokinase [Devosia sp.]
MSSQTDWVAVDWGTSNVRAWGIAGNGEQTFFVHSDKGMGRLSPAEFPSVLDELIGRRVTGPADVIICGMAGARQGWMEAPYVDTPADLRELLSRSVRPEGANPRLTPRILPGVAQRTAGHEDVMRGEETQLLGLLALRPGFEGTAILPGTHSKWVEIAGGRIVRFSSAMTGELYEVLSQHSVLRHSVSGAVSNEAADAGAHEGLEAGLGHPGLLSALIFRTRAAALLSSRGPDWCAGYLSGLLIGAEVGGHSDWLTGGPVPLIGSARFEKLYGAALGRIGVATFAIDAAEATIAGLKEARSQ